MKRPTASGTAVCPTCGMKTMTPRETAEHAKWHPAIRKAAR